MKQKLKTLLLILFFCLSLKSEHLPTNGPQNWPTELIFFEDHSYTSSTYYYDDIEMVKEGGTTQ